MKVWEIITRLKKLAQTIDVDPDLCNRPDDFSAEEIYERLLEDEDE